MDNLDFSFYPRQLELRAGDISLSTLPDFADVARAVRESSCIHETWFYAPLQEARELRISATLDDHIVTRPYSTRVFGLPRTHRIEHTGSTDASRLRFLMHCFGFFEGMRMDDTSRGYLDATPIEPGMLTDFDLANNQSLGIALNHADEFWQRHEADPAIANRVLGIFQSLSLSSYPLALQFEQFIWAYTAIEGAFVVGRETLGISNEGGHARRIENLCIALGVPLPPWATNQMVANVVVVRNFALHEGLFLQAPLGFQSFHGIDVPAAERHVTDGIPFAMRNFICRISLALLGIRPADYLQSSTFRRDKFTIQL